MNLVRKFSAVSVLVTLFLISAFAQDSNLPEY